MAIGGTPGAMSGARRAPRDGFAAFPQIAMHAHLRDTFYAWLSCLPPAARMIAFR